MHFSAIHYESGLKTDQTCTPVSSLSGEGGPLSLLVDVTLDDALPLRNEVTALAGE